MSAPKKRGLGRGLEALLGPKAADTATPEVQPGLFLAARLQEHLAQPGVQLDAGPLAQHVIDAQTTIMEDLPWIPVAIPYTTLIMNKRITGAPSSFQYMFGPWAAQLGGTG